MQFEREEERKPKRANLIDDLYFRFRHEKVRERERARRMGGREREKTFYFNTYILLRPNKSEGKKEVEM